jgi:DNA-binding NarL/FixJ family response regulator
MAENFGLGIPPAENAQTACIRVVVFESTRMGCELLSRALEASEYSLRVVETAFSSVEGERPRLDDVDVAVISSTLRDGPLSGFALLREVTKSHAAVRCVMLLDKHERSLVIDAFRFGAVGLCERDQSYEMLCKGVYSVYRGQVWANSQQLLYLLEALSAAIPGRITDVKGKILLTKREEEIVSLVADGLKNREIAEHLKLSEHTVKNHLFRVFERLGISSRAELILYLVGQRALSSSASVAT